MGKIVHSPIMPLYNEIFRPVIEAVGASTALYFPVMFEASDQDGFSNPCPSDALSVYVTCGDDFTLADDFVFEVSIADAVDDLLESWSVNGVVDQDHARSASALAKRFRDMAEKLESAIGSYTFGTTPGVY